MTSPDSSLPFNNTVSETVSENETADSVAEASPATPSQTDAASAQAAQALSDNSYPNVPAVPPSQTLSLQASLQSLLLPGLAFMLVGLVVGLRVAVQATLPHILEPGDYVNYQNIVEGLPVPRLLNWNTERLEWLSSLRELSGFTLPMLILFVFGPLWLVIVRRLNPTFRLVSHAPIASNSHSKDQVTSESRTKQDARSAATTKLTASSALATPLEFYGLVKALTLLVALGLPLAALWILVEWDDPAVIAGQVNLAPHSVLLIGSVWAMRLTILGAAFWICFPQDGLAGDFTRPEWNASRRRLPLLALRGLIFGLLAFAICRFALPQHLDEVLVRLQTLGDFNLRTSNLIYTHVLLSFGLVWFAIGGLFAFFSPPRPFRLHPAVLLLPFAACLASGLYQRPLSVSALASRYDIRPDVLRAMPEDRAYRPDAPASGVPEGEAVSQLLARQLGVPRSTPADVPGRTLILFAPTQTLMVYQSNITLDGFIPDSTFAAKATGLLKQRDYETAFSWTAVKNLYNVPLLRFDTTGAIRVGLEDLTHYPHNAQFASTLEHMLAVCAATPENEALLNQWADEKNFAFPSRESRRLMGDLYRRFGDIEKALLWYRKADMPSTFLQRVRAERLMFHAGTIHGVLRWNGQPLAGAQVAVVPSLMNGLPVGLEGEVRDALGSILNLRPRFQPAKFPPYHPYPWEFRMVSAATTTNTQGEYHIDHLTEGTYCAICTLPNGVQATLPFDSRLRITNPLPQFNVNYRHPEYDMGTTEMEWKTP